MGPGREAATVRQVVLVIVLVAAAFLGGASSTGRACVGPDAIPRLPGLERRGRDRLGRPQGRQQPRRDRRGPRRRRPGPSRSPDHSHRSRRSSRKPNLAKQIRPIASRIDQGLASGRRRCLLIPPSSPPLSAPLAILAVRLGPLEADRTHGAETGPSLARDTQPPGTPGPEREAGGYIPLPAACPLGIGTIGAGPPGLAGFLDALGVPRRRRIRPRRLPARSPLGRRRESARTAVSAGDDWAALGRKMQALGVSRFTIEGQPGGPVVFSCLIPLAGPSGGRPAIRGRGPGCVPGGTGRTAADRSLAGHAEPFVALDGKAEADEVPTVPILTSAFILPETNGGNAEETPVKSSWLEALLADESIARE